MMSSRQEIEKYASQLRKQHKFEYDSEEEYEDGTWEHKLRKAEMEATKSKSSKTKYPIYN